MNNAKRNEERAIITLVMLAVFIILCWVVAALNAVGIQTAPSDHHDGLVRVVETVP